ncbi:MAG: hypothetical protein ACRBF0_16955 [Calditrichia bacterium]
MKQFFSFLLTLAVGLAFYYLVYLQPGTDDSLETQFMMDIPTIFRSPGGDLEVAAFKTTEGLSRTTIAKLPFSDWEIPGTRTITEIQIPVTYRYHVRMRENWNIELRNGVCLVSAPKMRPTLPPAVHTDQMRIYSDEGLFAWDGQAELQRMFHELTPTFEENASSDRNLELIRDEARETVAEFVQAWLIDRGEWNRQNVEVITVVFAGEPEYDAASRRPTLTLRNRSTNENQPLKNTPKKKAPKKKKKEEEYIDGVPVGPFKK